MSAFQERKMVGHDNFVRNNPLSDKFKMGKFLHMEFYTSDAINTSRRFTWGLGMQQVAKSDQSTGNKACASVVVRSNDTVFVFTAPYGNPDDQAGSVCPIPGYDQSNAHKFITKHGLAVKTVGISCECAKEAYETSVANGAIGVLPATTLVDKVTGKTIVISEIQLLGDGVLRFVSGDYADVPYLPNYEPIEGPEFCYGITRIDHIVNNVPNMFDAVQYLGNALGLHEFSEFTAEDVGTVDSGLNSMVLANNTEEILFPVNEPTFGTRRKSQIQTFIEHNNGAGVQHIALKTNDIFITMRELKKRSFIGGFEFMPCPSADYYAKCPDRIGREVLTTEQWAELQELGLLADRDDQGVLLQVFSKPLGDRLTCFVEIIQRIGCDKDNMGQDIPQLAGCGGFGKGNFTELFKSIERFEQAMDDKLQK